MAEPPSAPRKPAAPKAPAAPAAPRAPPPLPPQRASSASPGPASKPAPDPTPTPASRPVSPLSPLPPAGPQRPAAAHFGLPPPAWNAAVPGQGAWNAQPYRPGRGLAIALTVLVPLLLLFGLVGAADSADIDASNSGGGAQVEKRVAGWGALGFVLGVPVIIVFCIWTYRAHANLRAIAPGAKSTPGWAVGSWFIPVAHLVLPAFPLARLWKGTNPRASLGLPMSWFVGWAVSTLLAMALGVWGFSLGFQEAIAAEREGREPEEIVLPGSYEALEWVRAIVWTIAGILMLVSIWQMEKMQAARAQQQASQPPQPPQAAPWRPSAPAQPPVQSPAQWQPPRGST